MAVVKIKIKMEITLNKEIEEVIIPATTKKTSKITVAYIIDSPAKKVVTACSKEIGNITLWEGAAYDAIGQWTDTDVQNRILEMYS